MKYKIDKGFIVISVIIGIILGVVLELLYSNKILGFASRIPCIAIYLLVYVVLLGIILMFKGLRNDAFANFGKVMALTLAAVIAFTGCSALFEFLYELGDGISDSNPSSAFQYVFLIDDSGSMDGNDPYDERYVAVQSIINNMSPTKDFAVYRFADITKCITPLGSKDSQTYTVGKPSDTVGGMTNLIGALTDVLSDISTSNKKHTKIIVLTDGAPSDVFLGNDNRAMKRCIKENASVSSVGFGQPNEQFLLNMANATGGVYVFSDNIDNLTSNLETVVQTNNISIGVNRDLLGERLDLTAGSFLYGFLRVLFLVLLGLLWTVIKMLLVGERKFTQKAAVVSVILCSLAALLLELLPSLWPARILFCALWACTLIPKQIYKGANLGSGSGELNNSNNGLNTNSGNSLVGNTQEVGGTKSFI